MIATAFAVCYMLDVVWVTGKPSRPTRSASESSCWKIHRFIESLAVEEKKSGLILHQHVEPEESPRFDNDDTKERLPDFHHSNKIAIRCLSRVEEIITPPTRSKYISKISVAAQHRNRRGLRDEEGFMKSP